MHITLQSAMTPELTRQLTGHLLAHGYQLDGIETQSSTGFSLRYGAGSDQSQLNTLLDVIAPFCPPLQADHELAAGTVILQLAPLTDAEQRVDIYAEQFAVLQQCTHQLEHMGFRISEAKEAYYEHPLIIHSDATCFEAQYLAFWAKQSGVDCTVINLKQSDDGLSLFYPDRSMLQLPPEQRFKIEIYTDAVEHCSELTCRLQQQGFENMVVLPAEKQLKQFKLHLGPLRDPSFQMVKAKLLLGLSDDLRSQGVAEEYFPLKIKQHKKVKQATYSVVRIFYPMAAFLSGELRCYSGDTPARFALHLMTDSEEHGEQLAIALEQEGFARPEITIKRLPYQQFSVELGTDKMPKSCHLLKQVISQQILQLGANLDDYKFSFSRKNSTDVMYTPTKTTASATIYFPTEGVQSGERLARIATGLGLSLKITTPTPELWQQVQTDFQKNWHFKGIKVRHEGDDGSASIRYGGASPAFISALERYCQETLHFEHVRLDHCWGEEDTDVYLHLPAYQPPVVQTKAEPQLSTIKPPRFMADRPFVCCQGQQVRIADLTFQTGSKADREPAPFKHFCFDQITANSLYFIAQSVQLNEPCLLIGETAVAKTSAILYLAWLLDQPVVRVNLSAQTEVSDLIGRFVPCGAEHNPIGEHELQHHKHLLSAKCQAVLEQARHQQRKLTAFELAAILSQENLPQTNFVWQDGPVVKAMKTNAWLVFDELNTAHSSVLERLNELFEPAGGLTLYEYDNRRIAAGPGFRMFATMNPGTYSGRQLLSTAWLDRWSIHKVAPSNETALRAMLQQWVFGEGPSVIVGVSQYPGATIPALFPQLHNLPGIELFLEQLATFHVGMAKQVTTDASLGSRRTLFNVLRFLHQAVDSGTDAADALEQAIQRYYMGCISEPQEYAAAQQYLVATGLIASIEPQEAG